MVLLSSPTLSPLLQTPPGSTPEGERKQNLVIVHHVIFSIPFQVKALQHLEPLQTGEAHVLFWHTSHHGRGSLKMRCTRSSFPM